MSKAIKMKPTSPGRRGMVKVVTPGLYSGKPFSSLVVSKKQQAGRSTSTGRITTRHRGGGHKRHYRIIDWKRKKDNITGKIERLEYDPNRTAHIALVLYADGERRYILAPTGLKVNDQVLSGRESPIKRGNCLPLHNIPVGTVVHCIERTAGKGAQVARSAGTSAQILGKEGVYSILRLKSGEVIKVHMDCRATIGEVGNSAHNLRKLGKAGRARWMSKRPTVRGVAMNPVDHPLGGGEGKSSGGRVPCSPWGLKDGKKTRRIKRTDVLIVRRRRRKTDKDGRK